MVLDALVKINDQIDPTLAFRRFCREGGLNPAKAIASTKRMMAERG